MNHQSTAEDRKRIKLSIQQKYAKVAAGPEGNFRYPTGRAGLEGQKYDPEIIRTLPEDVVESYCGVGNPFILGSIHEGDTILDVGCGAGVDTLIAAMMAGRKGKAVGIDLVSDMVERAKQNLGKTSLENAEFQDSSAESLSFPEESFDVVISNGVINLIPDKAKALREIFRVLKLNGRLMIADQVLAGEVPTDTKSMVEKWAGWQGGAISGKDFLTLLVQTGFADAELVAETGFNSSPVTKGVLFRAVKSRKLVAWTVVAMAEDVIPGSLKTVGEAVMIARNTAAHSVDRPFSKVVIIPVHIQHHVLLQRNLIYTGITRGRKLVVLVGTKKALTIAVKNNKAQRRYTRLKTRLTLPTAKSQRTKEHWMKWLDHEKTKPEIQTSRQENEEPEEGSRVTEELRLVVCVL